MNLSGEWIYLCRAEPDAGRRDVVNLAPGRVGSRWGKDPQHALDGPTDITIGWT